MLKRLIAFLVGSLRIEVRGAHLERFLNLALAEGLLLWNIRRGADSLQATVTIRDFRLLRPVARGARCKVAIKGRYGFPFRLVRVKRRPMLLVGLALGLAFVFWASSHVWVVEVKITGPQNLDPRAVAAVAAEAGLVRGARKGGLHTVQVEKHLQARLKEISWAVVRIQGTRAVVEVVEKAARQLPNQSECVNLVARKDGVVEEVIPFQGEPVVKRGDTVRAGDLLVECALKYWQGGRPMVIPGMEKPPRETVARTLVAQAVIRARVTYRRYVEIPLVKEVPVRTGRTATRWVLKWQDRSILIKGDTQVSFAAYEETQKAYSPGGWRNWQSPVELVIVEAHEVTLQKEHLTTERALQMAKEQMSAHLRWVLGPSDEIISPMTAAVVEQGSQYLGIRVAVETLEDVTAPREGAAPILPQTSGTAPDRP